MPKYKVNYGEILSEIVDETMLVMRDNGYDMPNYRVINKRHSDISIHGPLERHAFFAYIDSGLITRQKIIVSMYEADKLPVKARAEWIKYIIGLHYEVDGGFNLELCLTNSKYKKPQLGMPSCFVKLVLTEV